MKHKTVIALIVLLFAILLPVNRSSAQTNETASEDSTNEGKFDGDIYGEVSYKEFVKTCRDAVDSKNIWLFSSEEKRSICSDEIVAKNSAWSNFLNSKTYGDYPIHNYQIISDDGRFYNAVRQIKDLLTGLLFSLVLGLTAATTLLLEFAYEFKIISWLATTFGDLSDKYLYGLGYGGGGSLYLLALFATSFIAGMHALKGRLAKAGSEVLGAYITAFVLALIVALGGFLNPILGLINTTLDISDELAGAVLEPHEDCVTSSKQNSEEYKGFLADNPVAKRLAVKGSFDSEELMSNSQDEGSVDISEVIARDNSTSVCTAIITLQESFVAEPYDYVQWGEDVDVEALSNCAIARDVILSKKWTSNDPEPRFLMRHAGDECKRLAEFNHDPSVERMSMAFVGLIVALIGLSIVLWALIQLLVAQMKLMFVIATGAWAFLSGMGPSSLRGGFYGWINALLKSVLDLVAISLFLAFYLSVYSAISSDSRIAWSAKSILLCLVSVAFFVARKKAKNKSQLIAQTATNSVAKTQVEKPKSIEMIEEYEDAPIQRSRTSIRNSKDSINRAASILKTQPDMKTPRFGSPKEKVSS